MSPAAHAIGTASVATTAMNRFFIVGSVGALSGAKTIAGASITIPRIPENKLMQIEEMSIASPACTEARHVRRDVNIRVFVP